MREPEESKEPEEEEEEESTREEGPSRRPSPTVIVIASVVALILIIGAIYFIFIKGNDLESLAVGNIYDRSDGIEFDIYATPSGFGEYDGDVTVEIFFEDKEEPLFSDKVRINEGKGFETVPYEEFMWDNGEYIIKVSGEGKESTNSKIFNNVVTSVQVEWEGIYPDSDSYEIDYFVEVDIIYKFGDRTNPSSAFPQGYSFEGNILDPTGTNNALSSNLNSITEFVDHTTKGTYTLSGSVTNTFCKTDSPYRTIDIVTNTTFTYDAAPFSMAGDNVFTALSGGEAVVNFDGSGSWDDGAIASYRWNFGENATFETTTQPIIQHTYTAAGEYNVILIVVDDTNKESLNGKASTMVVTVTES